MGEDQGQILSKILAMQLTTMKREKSYRICKPILVPLGSIFPRDCRLYDVTLFFRTWEAIDEGFHCLVASCAASWT
jgi:hypothetical protein